MMTLLRRVFWLALLGGAGFAGWSAWSRRNESVKARPPDWPPIELPTQQPVAPGLGERSTDEPTLPEAPRSDPVVPAAFDPSGAGGDSFSAQPGAHSTAFPPSVPTSSEPPETAASRALTWVAPDGGACPSSHPIKANSNSGIFHVPGGRFYNQTRAERCYALAEDAEADGYRRAKS